MRVNARVVARSAVATVIVALVMAVTVDDGLADGITETGDVLQVVLPAGAWLSTFVAGSPDGGRWDREGTKQATYSIGGALITQRVWKVIAKKMRPHGGARSSFPSGHTTAAFSGAGFLQRRYGWKIGGPAYAAAGFVGWSRVRADAHFADDVTAGASIAMLFAARFVTPRGGGATIAPTVTDDGVGLEVNVPLGAPTEGNQSSGAAGGAAGRGRRAYRYNFAWGPAYVIHNEISSPAEGGTRFDLADFDKIDDPTTTAAADFDVTIDDHHEIDIFWQPFESRDTGSSTVPIAFGGATLPANTPLRSAWRLYDMRGIYRYRIPSPDPWRLSIGGGLMVQYLDIELATQDKAVMSKINDTTALPIASVVLAHLFSDHIGLALMVDGTRLPEDWMLDAGLFLEYHFSTHWDATAGYQYYGREIATDELLNKVNYNVPYLAVAYSW